MRGILIFAWLLIPPIILGFHYGPGQKGVILDQAAGILAAAERHASAEEWAQAIEEYDRALELLPVDQVARIRQVRLAKARAQMFASQLPEANRALEELLSEVTQDPKADPSLAAQTRGALANSQYYMTWLLRLEGTPREEWWPFIEGARQNYRLLAEEGAPNDRERAKKDLDATLRLARLDLSELQALPLPSQ